MVNLDLDGNKEGEQEFMDFEQSHRDVGEDAAGDVILQVSQSRLDVLRLHRLHHCLVEHLHEVLQRELVHVVNCSQVSHDEKQNASSGRNSLVNLSVLLDFLLHCLTVLYFQNYLFTYLLRIYQDVHQLVII